MRVAGRRDEILDGAATVFAESGVRASLEEIAASCGIQTGSLYHHFDSKDALVTALLERFLDELSALTAATAGPSSNGPGSTIGAMVDLACGIARAAQRNRAAMMLTYIEPPSASSTELRERARQIPDVITGAMEELVVLGQKEGALRPDLESRAVAELICQNMLQVAVSSLFRSGRRSSMPELKCRIMMTGIAEPSARPGLVAGPAHRAVDDLVVQWRDQTPDPNERRRRIEAAARREFARRGVALTTVRDVAAAAELDPRAVYRVVPSKDELVRSILEPYYDNFALGWNRVIESAGEPLERLDAVLWLVINLHDKFREEQRVAELAAQQAPPAELTNRHGSFVKPFRQLRQLLAAADRQHALRVLDVPATQRVSAVFSATFPAANISWLTPEERLVLARATVLEGLGLSDEQTAR